MRHDKLERELYLIELLTENRSFTVEKLCEKVGVSRRNLYYYLEFLRDSGFIIYKQGNCYCIDRSSPFFNRIINRISFTEEEAVLIRRLADKADSGNPLVGRIKKKLDAFYDLNILSIEDMEEHAVHNISVLYDAIKFKRQVVLKGYASPHSHTIKDRIVEPFLLMNNNREVRCFEPVSQMNKTFKISRMQDVMPLDTEWQHQAEHRKMYTDVFMFSGEERMPVSMLLGTLSYNIMKEEYPKATRFITACPDGRHRLEMDVCSYAGIGRFVLGLYEDIEVIGDEGFKAYLREKIKKMNEGNLS